MGPKYNVFIKKEDRFIFENVPRGTFERERKEGLYKYVPRGTLSLNMLKAEKLLKKKNLGIKEKKQAGPILKLSLQKQIY